MLPRSVYAKKLGEFSNLVFAEDAAFQFASNWQELFRKRLGESYDGRLVCEIGCADASYLARIASKFPNTGFVGLDWKCKPIYDGATRISNADIRNIVLIRCRAQEIARVFGSRELDELWVFHPDPPMPQTFQGRLIGERFLLDAHAILRQPDSKSYITLGLPAPSCGSGMSETLMTRDLQKARPFLAIKTDHADYYGSIISTIAENEELREKFSLSMHSADFWADREAQSQTAGHCFAGEKTTFEKRFTAKGFPIHYIELRPSSL